VRLLRLFGFFALNGSCNVAPNGSCNVAPNGSCNVAPNGSCKVAPNELRDYYWKVAG